MSTNYIDYFLKGAWLNRAKEYIGNSEKLKGLLGKVSEYVNRSGLATVKSTLLLMYDYVMDTATGRYKDYSIGNLTMIIAALIYLVSPLDFIPDLIPGGLFDDAAILSWAFNRAGEELANYQAWRERTV
ncbi:MAG: YkvA family protein [Parabacteroides sp.]|nr:YkvA family protein [bacterium]MDY4101829.1 YkvA family protein [Parabacteroides sp.]